MKKIIKFLKSIIISAGKGVSQDPEAQKLMERYPRFFQFLRRRFTRKEERGLYLTVGSVIVGIFVYYFLSIVKDIIGQDVLVQADLRIVNLVQIFHTPALNKIMLFITYLGNWQAVFLGVLIVSFILVSLKLWRQLIVLLSSVIGGQIFVWIVKNIVARPRPPLANSLLPLQDYSFPSGHSFIVFSFYGLITYFAFRYVQNKLLKIFLVTVGMVGVMSIGFSRIYLGVHWASDVLASFAIGSAWLTGFITFIEIRKKYKPKEKENPYFKNSSIIFIAIFLVFVWVYYVSYFYKNHPLKPQGVITESAISVTKDNLTQSLFSSFPRTSENISGEPMEPVDIIIVANPEDMEKILERSGWQMTDPITLKTTGRLFYDSIFNKAYPKAPGIPSFWNREPNNLAFEKPTEKNSARERHHVHFWETPFVLNDGRRVWVATAHFDKGINIASSLFIPTHVIDPAIDKERDKITQDLSDMGIVESLEQFQIVEPTLGTNQGGNQFFTDGKADVIYLKK
jgi:membrane-associated phospholipid phosphatase